MIAEAKALARRWLELARARDFAALGPALAVKKRLLEAARDHLRADPKAYAELVGAFVAGLADRRPRVRFECAHALDQFGGPDEVPALVALMEDPVPRVRGMAMHALSCHACGEGSIHLDPAVVARIAAAARSDPSARVRRDAVAALGLGHAPGVAEVLAQVLAADPPPKLKRLARWAFEVCEDS